MRFGQMLLETDTRTGEQEIKHSNDESTLPLNKNLTGTLAAQDSAGEGDAEHQPGDDTRREEPLRS